MQLSSHKEQIPEHNQSTILLLTIMAENAILNSKEWRVKEANRTQSIKFLVDAGLLSNE